MRIVLANKFYYRRGGDCIYAINVEELLRKHGHDVSIFAMQHPQNLPSEWSKYFPEEVNFQFGRGMAESLMRPFGTKEVRKKFGALIKDFKPDVVHVNNIHSQLSPVIAEMAHDRGIRVVWTLHDYKLLCPRYDCLRNGKAVCEECFGGKRSVLKYKCMKNSLFASAIAYAEAVKWSRERLENITDTFICPSCFMAEKMRQGGFNERKLVVLSNFIDTDKCRKDDYEREDYYCYVGRLSHEKGVKTLIKAADHLPYKLKIVGSGPLYEDLQAAGSNVEFAGFRQWDDIKKIAGRARFCVIPSEWYENNPLSAIESLCLGTPLLGARIGGIPELISGGVNGLTFESGNAEELTKKIEEMYGTPFNNKRIAERARATYNAEKYYGRLIEIYNK